MNPTLLTTRGRILIFILMAGPATRQMLEEQASLSDRSVERALGTLRKAGLIEWHTLRHNGPRWWSVKEGLTVSKILLDDAQS